MDEKEGHGGGFRRDKDDDHPDHHKDRNDDDSLDEVPQAEAIDDIFRGLLRMFGNNDREDEHLNVEVRENQMDRRGDVGVVGGQSCYELGESSTNRDVLNHMTRPRGQNTGNIGSSSNGTLLGNRIVLGQGTSGTQPVFPSGSLSHGPMSNQSNLIGQGTNGARHVYHSESSNHGLMLNQRNVLGQGTNGTPRGLHLESSNHGTMSDQRNVLGQGTNGTGNVLRSVSSNHGPMSNERNGLGQNGQGIGTTVAVLHSRSVIVAPPRQMGRFTVSQEIPTFVDTVFFIPRGVHEHNTLVELGMYRHTRYQAGRFRVSITEPPILNSGFFIPRAVLDHNMRIQSDQNMVNGNMFRQETPMVQMGNYRGFYGAPTHPFFPTFASQGLDLSVAGPSVNMPRVSDHEYNVVMLPNPDMANEPSDEHNGTMGEASHREEAVSQHDRHESDTGHENGQGSASGDAKRTKR